jgi:hypothetical protein
MGTSDVSKMSMKRHLAHPCEVLQVGELNGRELCSDDSHKTAILRLCDGHRLTIECDFGGGGRGCQDLERSGRSVEIACECQSTGRESDVPEEVATLDKDWVCTTVESERTGCRRVKRPEVVGIRTILNQG